MKTFKDLSAFERRVAKSTAWEDYFKMGGRMYTIYEYGGGFQKGDEHYVYFINKKTHDAIHVRYDLPSVNYVAGERVETGSYKLYGVEFQPNMCLWRPII